MNKDISKRIEEIAIELTNQPSISDTEGELKVSQKVYDIMNLLK